MAELYGLDLISCNLLRSVENNVMVGGERVPEVSYVYPVFVAGLSKHNKETCPGIGYDKWWIDMTTGLKLTRGGSTILKEDIWGLVEPWLQEVRRRSIPWEKVHLYDVFKVIHKLVKENARVQVLAKKVAQGTNVLLDKVPLWEEDRYPPDMPSLVSLSSMETHQQ